MLHRLQNLLFRDRVVDTAGPLDPQQQDEPEIEPALTLEEEVTDAQEAYHGDIAAMVLTDAMRTDAANDPNYRAALHAYGGAKAMVRDLVINHTPHAAVLANVTGLSPVAVAEMAERLVDRYCEGEGLDLSPRERVVLASCMADFVAVTFYASCLRADTFTDEWLTHYEAAAIAPRLPEPQPDRPDPDEWR